jgi:hypothetical protein
MGMAAEGDDVIKGRNWQLLYQFGLLARDIDANFGHDPNRIGIESLLFDSGGICLENVSTQIPSPTLSHLAAAGIAGAEEKDGRFSRFV